LYKLPNNLILTNESTLLYHYLTITCVLTTEIQYVIQYSGPWCHIIGPAVPNMSYSILGRGVTSLGQQCPICHTVFWAVVSHHWASSAQYVIQYSGLWCHIIGPAVPNMSYSILGCGVTSLGQQCPIFHRPTVPSTSRHYSPALKISGTTHPMTGRYNPQNLNIQ